MKRLLVCISVCFIILFSGCPNPLDSGDDGGGGGGAQPVSPGAIEGSAMYIGQTDHSGILISIEKVTGITTASVEKALRTNDIGSSAIGGAMTTDASGTFRFEDVEPGSYVVYASSDDSTERAVMRGVTVNPGATSLIEDLQLTPTGSISGKVLNNDVGERGWVVYIEGTSYDAWTDREGNFTISNVPVGTDYPLVVHRDWENQFAGFFSTVTAGQDDNVGELNVSTASTVHWGAGKGAPSSDSGDTGDFYIDLETGKMYQKGDSKWIVAVDLTGPQGVPGQDGADGVDGTDGTDGADGEDGVSIIWRGTASTHPRGPTLNWAYYNNADNVTYIYDGDSWEVLSKHVPMAGFDDYVERDPDDEGAFGDFVLEGGSELTQLTEQRMNAYFANVDTSVTAPLYDALQSGYNYLRWGSLEDNSDGAIVMGKGPDSNYVLVKYVSQSVINAIARILHVDPDTGDYATISAALAVAQRGDVISIGPGEYQEQIIVNKRVSFIGAGSHSGGTVITLPFGHDQSDEKMGVIQLDASGDSEERPILFKDLRVEVNDMAGFSVGLHNQETNTSVSYIKLDNVTVVGNNVPGTEKERGLYVDATSTLRYLTVSDSTFENLTYGWYFFKKVSSDRSTVEHVDVTNTSFSRNNIKGIYAEKLSYATFTDCSFTDNGFTVEGVPGNPDRQSWLAGVDINLKAGDYRDIEFYNSTITGNAVMTDGSAGAREGVGLTIKARDDSSYSAYPATLQNVVIDGGVVRGNERGIRIGEPGKDNLGPQNVVVRNVALYGNEQSYEGEDGTAYGDLINATDATLSELDARNNYWGASTGPITGSDAPTVSGNMDISRWYETEQMRTLRYYNARNSSTGVTYRTIQAAIDDAANTNTITVQPGIYRERIVISKPLTLLGATHDVNKNGYSVPYNYEWDERKESIISNPEPALTTSNVVDIVDTDDVTFRGFVVQSLNALASSANDHLLRVYAHTSGVSNIDVSNNVIGPNTNVEFQDGTAGRMGLYLAMPNYTDSFDITDSSFSGNKIFGALGNGNNVFIWGSATAYHPDSPAPLPRGDLTGTRIEDNEIYGSNRSGIEIAGSADNLVIEDNLIYGNGGSGTEELKYGNGIVIIRMGSDKTNPDGQGSVGITIENNEIYDNEKNGIYMGPVNSAHTISGNTIRDNGWDAIRFDLDEAYHDGAVAVYNTITTEDDVIVVTGNTLLADSPYFGIRVLPSSMDAFDPLIRADNNLWGADSGPYHEVENPNGEGSQVSDYVDISESAGEY